MPRGRRSFTCVRKYICAHTWHAFTCAFIKTIATRGRCGVGFTCVLNIFVHIRGMHSHGMYSRGMHSRGMQTVSPRVGRGYSPPNVDLHMAEHQERCIFRACVRIPSFRTELVNKIWERTKPSSH